MRYHAAEKWVESENVYIIASSCCLVSRREEASRPSFLLDRDRSSSIPPSSQAISHRRELAHVSPLTHRHRQTLIVKAIDAAPE